jgi:hypothetical protein
VELEGGPISWFAFEVRTAILSSALRASRKIVASPMGDEHEDKADQDYDATRDRDGDVDRVNMRIPFQLGLSDFIFFSLATLAQADSTDSASRQDQNLDIARPRRLDDRQILHFSGLRRRPAH